jgi:lycopene beta-cyclase
VRDQARTVDVLVVGAGPAGWALAGQCAEHGLHTALVDPAPHRRWRPTYAGWADQLPPLPATAIAAAPQNTVAFGTRRHAVSGGYRVLANDGLRAYLTDPRVAVLTGRAVEVTHHRWDSAVRLADGRTLRARLVVDATGASQALARTGRGSGVRYAAQTAVGMVLPTAEAAALLDGADAVVMDWRQPRSAGGRWPTFLYVVPIADDRVLVEETSLARRPGLPTVELRARLAARLARAGIDRPVQGRLAETVRIPLDLPIPRPGRVVPFGTAAAMVHPATGYGVADALGMAPVIADRIAATLPHGPKLAASAAHLALWPPRARAVRRLRRRGLAALMALPPAHIASFFDLFFTLPEQLRHAYLNERENFVDTTMAMATLFCSAPWRLRITLAVTTSKAARPV